jgi:hypothetical protein
MAYTEEEVKQALNELVENGELKLIIRNGEPMYIENTYNAGYAQALKDYGLAPPQER